MTRINRLVISSGSVISSVVKLRRAVRVSGMGVHAWPHQASQDLRDLLELLRLVEKEIGAGGPTPQAVIVIDLVRQQHHRQHGVEVLCRLADGPALVVW